MARNKSGWAEWTSGRKKDLATARLLFGATLRARREDLHTSQAELSESVGISTKTLNGIEFGRNWPSLPVYFAICRALSCGKIPLIS